MTRAKEMRDLPLAIDVDSSGNVGIGATTPSDQLAGAANLVIGTTSDADSGMTFVSTTTGQSLIHFSDANSGNARYDGFIGYEQNNQAMKFGTAQAERMRINSSGNVGIGASTGVSDPVSRLNVRSANNHTSGSDREDLVTFHQGISAWQVGRGAGIRWVGDVSRTMAGISAYVFGVEQTGLAFETGGANSTGNLKPTTRMVIDHNGKVGIGTASPRRHLHINGGNESTKIQITNQTTGSSTDGEGFQLGIATDGTANLEQRENAAMVLSTNNTERVRIHSSGRFGIGTSGNTIQGSLVVKDVTDHNGSDVFVVAQNGNASRVAGYKVFDEGGTASLEMKYDNGSNTATVRNPNNGALSIYLGGTGSANQLDDYEEGTFTAAFGNGHSGSITIANSFKTGVYTKVGNLVTFTIHIRTSAVNNPGGVLDISGLPFSGTPNNYKNRYSFGNCVYFGFTGMGSNEYPVAYMSSNTTTISFALPNTNNIQSFPANRITASSEFYVTGFYHTS